MKEDDMKVWVKALRSGTYVQGRGMLRVVIDDAHEYFRYCCLGVYAKIKVPDWNENIFKKEDEEILDSKFCGISEYWQNKLTDLNDNKGYSFNEIADFIEENWEDFENDGAAE